MASSRGLAGVQRAGALRRAVPVGDDGRGEEVRSLRAARVSGARPGRRDRHRGGHPHGRPVAPGPATVADPRGARGVGGGAGDQRVPGRAVLARGLEPAAWWRDRRRAGDAGRLGRRRRPGRAFHHRGCRRRSGDDRRITAHHPCLGRPGPAALRASRAIRRHGERVRIRGRLVRDELLRRHGPAVATEHLRRRARLLARLRAGPYRLDRGRSLRRHLGSRADTGAAVAHRLAGVSMDLRAESATGECRDSRARRDPVVPDDR